MHSDDQLDRLLLATAYSGDGQTIGPVAAVYVDDVDRPAWVSIVVEADGTERLAPLARSWLYPGHRLVLAVIRRAVEGAPVAPSGHLAAEEEDVLFRYYAHVITPASSRALPASVVDARLTRATDPAAVRLRRVAVVAGRPVAVDSGTTA
ncbi:hypothetical protein I4I73_10590 [Pseudonocardia sp. KRD-184]|uniref:Uncharacterized protein n=1 Tax=Pseudonocardia oceani TaxID=2792013 RepID=A0ABS6UGA6_9PSEU|nr:hypothetical protein [Pseudonocardia oceani]MBW0089429.1 hypothetical protein [Pseudonocardia oceani]MBW0096435.1 hypothetical protein [Pseudonocardia oceani]MBW0108752.1 hypothetical protein [Pseudonocardia oceani]MBW0122980.1 hypothetical protein [Pseudonocardia oceani]MBW0131253.1 hypothetical protein [Pseudonocardia oceani]